ncbi:MAG: DNA (cytosine-5-)-methyltransferase [Gammaproteobacteria bacterium]|nr:DNA (cytosine-5-)-methyltransferase [Gammaproteobacteria bacterium]
MYNELISHLVNRIKTAHRADCRSESLVAPISHWLSNQAFDYGFDADEQVTLQHALDNFLLLHGLELQEVIGELPHPRPAESQFDFIDLFAGIGGFNLALQANGGKCVFSCEWDKTAQATYFANYGKYPFGDINEFTSELIEDDEIDRLIPNHRILAAGFPCQPFSLAGVSARTSRGQAHGFECKTQGTLFYSIARIARVKQPEVLYLENVKNIISHDGGNTIRVIIDELENNISNGEDGKFNYVFKHQIVSSETLVAQRRQRCFMVCIREDIAAELGAFEFPRFEGAPLPLRNALETLTDEEVAEYTISDALWQGHINRSNRNRERNTGFVTGEANLDKPSNTIVARYGKDGKECLIPQGEGLNPRKLTKTECARLFGYPDNFILPQAKTPAYKLLGNSVVVPVVTRIASSIVDYLGEE